MCTEGFLTTDTLIKVGDKEYWKTTFPDNTIEYSMREFDKERRMVIARWGMSNRSDSTGNFSKYEYDDEEYIETITSSRIGVEDTFGTIVINYCNSNWIPLKREVIELNDGIKTLRRFEFTRVE